MAKPIEIGLVLEGQDAVEFEEYMKNPTYSQPVIDCMKKAIQMKNRDECNVLLNENRDLMIQNEKLRREIQDLKDENDHLRRELTQFV